MSDDPHPCMKVTSHVRKFLTMTAAAVKIQERDVPQISSDDIGSSILVLNAENIAATYLSHNKKFFPDDLRPYLLVPEHSGQCLCASIGKVRFFDRRFSFN